MRQPRKVRCYQYVEQPYDAVRKLLRERPLEVLQRATTTAAARADSLAAQLRVGVAGVEVGVAVKIHVTAVRDEDGVGGLAPVTHVMISWEAAKTPALFPLMSAQLSAWALSSSETQLEIEGEYRPPLGAVGDAIDAAVGHRIAEASVLRFLEDVVQQVRKELQTAA
jgi:hypothetical protein